MRPRSGRQGKVRPIPGNPPHDRPVSRGYISLKQSLRRSLPRPLPGAAAVFHTEAPRYAFSEAWRNLSGPMWSQNQNQNQTRNQTPGRDRTASRWSAPRPGSRTCREDHAPSHRPQMSSGRLLLDRVARQQSPSPPHRQAEHNTHSSAAWGKGDISTLLGGRHFYSALTRDGYLLDSGSPNM